MNTNRFACASLAALSFSIVAAGCGGSNADGDDPSSNHRSETTSQGLQFTNCSASGPVDDVVLSDVHYGPLTNDPRLGHYQCLRPKAGDTLYLSRVCLYWPWLPGRIGRCQIPALGHIAGIWTGSGSGYSTIELWDSTGLVQSYDVSQNPYTGEGGGPWFFAASPSSQIRFR